VTDVGLLDPLVQGTRALELTDDSAFLAAMAETEVALCGALVDVGLAPKWMLRVCTSLAAPELLPIALAARHGGNPVIPLVDALKAAAEAEHPGASNYVHLGATSQDILDTATMLVARSVCLEVVHQLTILGDSLARLAETHRSTPMVARTLGQHAARTTVGFVLAGWLDGVTSAVEAIDRVGPAIPLQLGGAVGTRAVLDGVGAEHGVAADAVVAALARRLGLRASGLPWHSNRAPVLTIAGALAQAVAAVGVIGLDVGVLSRTEIAEVSERGGGGSSAMPHKSNPVSAVLITAAARRAPHALAAVYSAALTEDQRAMGAWHAEWLPLRELERIAVATTSGTAALVDGLHVDTERMATNLNITHGLIDSERVSTALAAVLPRAEAFDLVRRAASESMHSGRPLHDTVGELVAHNAELAEAAHRVFAELSDTAGAPGPSIHTAISEAIAAFNAATSVSTSAATSAATSVSTSAATRDEEYL
jgi:3-carboxy-cis,cis-muconate cycloisomerase